MGGVAGEIAVRELLADITSDALSKYPNTLEKDRRSMASDPTKPAGKQAKKKKSFAELRGPSEEELKKFPDADAWVGVFPGSVRQTQRSVAAARVRVSERRILAKTGLGGEAAAEEAQGFADDGRELRGRVPRGDVI